jgi:hypothetical protein
MKTLSPECRRQLERTVVQAREVAEAGARAALEALAVHHHEPYGHMDSDQRTLRRRLRAHARQLGDRLETRSGSQSMAHLVHECAYEHWHGMLFARFLAENHLLIEPQVGVAITLAECEELAKEEGVDQWALAARFAHRMLPQVFRPDHPVLEVRFAREHCLKLEGLVESLPAEVFTATDALGWVYQFWQSKKKDEVNRSEVKIGADELPAVTQLFTEPYMVQFLLHNSLGAWWASRFPDQPCPVELTYLRTTDEGLPAAGRFEGWPDDLSAFRLLDPCCGSGHFLVAAFLMLVPMRMALEGLSAAEAVDAVLRDNLHGLELDRRCVAIAAFALALEAWRYPNLPSPAGRGAGGEGPIGYRSLPRLNLAWCGQPVAGQREQWLALAEGNSRLESGMAVLYDTFRDAPLLGSLIDPTRSVREDLLTAGFADLEPLLERALREHAGEEEWEETAIAARGLTDAARLLGGRYHLVITNVPYLARGKQGEALRKFSDRYYPNAKNELATTFVARCIERLDRGGTCAVVTPQNWLFLTSYTRFRKQLLTGYRWNLVCKLGPAAFREMNWWAANTSLLLFSNGVPTPEQTIAFIEEAANTRDTGAKPGSLRSGRVAMCRQMDQLTNPDHRLVSSEGEHSSLLTKFATSLAGIQSGDYPRYGRFHWELPCLANGWIYQQSTVRETKDFGGREQILRWEDGQGDMARSEGAYIRGLDGWGRHGVAISQMRHLPASLFSGNAWDNNTAVILPLDDVDLPAIWAFCSSSEYRKEVRKVDQKTNVTNATLLKVPFDIRYWRGVARKNWPTGLPSPWSQEPTQWIFHGHPRSADSPLQVAVARLLGYRWPAENDPEMGLAEEARFWVTRASALSNPIPDTRHLSPDTRHPTPLIDEDGIVCLPSVRGELPAHERLLSLLQAAWNDAWNDGVLANLLAEAGTNSLDDWLRNQFFEQHCKLFHHRPFIWHLWDGRKRDGFHALVNYHKLTEGKGKGRRLLESLTYSYLGDWIARQQDSVKRGEGGAEDRLAAALELQKRLVAIIEGKPPFDLFVRWKPINKQPIGWEPDINDGVRLNIRPFMAQDLPGGKKGAGILRAKPNVHWKKDRGKEPGRDQMQFPWFWRHGRFTGERINDVHLTSAEKRAAREQAESEQ